MEKTVIADWIGEDKVGYWVGFFLSPENQRKIADLHSQLYKELPGMLWTMPDITQQHVTLFEIVMCLGKYSEDRDTIFEQYRGGIDAELRALLTNRIPITVTLNTLEASPATIIVRGTDDGSFQHIRNAISSKHLLPKGTRTPPDIIHSSLARYIKEVDLEHIRSVVARHQLKLTQQVTEFEMVKISRPPMDYATLRVYKFASLPK
jgi:hypothetical protein